MRAGAACGSQSLDAGGKEGEMLCVGCFILRVEKCYCSASSEEEESFFSLFWNMMWRSRYTNFISTLPVVSVVCG